MKHIRKYNESKINYSQIVTSFIDEVSSVFDDDKWGIIERSVERIDKYYEFELKDYQKYPDLVFLEIGDGFVPSTKHPFISIGLKCGNTNPYNKDVFSKINEDINILNNIKKLFKNLEHLNIYVPFDYEYVGYDLLSLRIDLKWHLLKSS